MAALGSGHGAASTDTRDKGHLNIYFKNLSYSREANWPRGRPGGRASGLQGLQPGLRETPGIQLAPASPGETSSLATWAFGTLIVS